MVRKARAVRPVLCPCSLTPGEGGLGGGVKGERGRPEGGRQWAGERAGVQGGRPPLTPHPTHTVEPHTTGPHPQENYVNPDGSPIPNAFDGDSYYSSWAEIPRPFRCKARNVSAQPVVASAFWVLFTLVSGECRRCLGQ